MSQTILNGVPSLSAVQVVPVKGLTGGSKAAFNSAWLGAANVPHTTVPAGAAAEEAFPAVNTPEWDAMNKRRDELIRKNIDGVLTPAEREEYERLQRLSLAAVVKAFPRPKPDFEELDRLRKELGATSAPEAE